MKLVHVALCILFSISMSSAQNFQGKAVYLSKTKVDFDFGGRKIPEEQKQRMLKRLEEQSQKSFVLHFDKTASIYEEEAVLDAPGGNERGRMFAAIFGGPGAGRSYKNIVTKESKRAVEFFGKNFLVEDQLKMYPWTLEKETKKIGKYNCFKATTFVDKKQNPFSQNKDSLQTQTKITVWYTPEIPVSLGPDSFWGLPGLILAVSGGDTQIICKQVTLNVKEKAEIKAPKSGKKISEEEFQQLVMEKTKELRERFKKGHGGRGGRRGGGAR